MRVMETPTTKRFKDEHGHDLRMVWEVNTISSPEGARVIVVDLTKPVGQGRIFDETGFEQDLDRLKERGEEMIRAYVGQLGSFH
jgi:hypothetical protein